MVFKLRSIAAELLKSLFEQLMAYVTSIDGSHISFFALTLFSLSVVILVKSQIAHPTLATRTQDSSWRSAFQLIFPKNIYFSSSFKRDVQLFLFFLVVFAPVSLYLFPLDSFYDIDKNVSSFVTTQLSSNIFGLFKHKLYFTNDWWLIVIHTLGTLMVYDLGVYTSHRFQHTNKYLWEFHKVHHSADKLNPLTNYRAHLTGFLNGGLGALFAGVFNGLLYILFEKPIGYSLLGEILIFDVVVFLLLNLGHSHLWISFGRFEKIFYSPAMHLIHHSRDPKHYDKNFASVFSIWDRMGGTIYTTSKKPPQNFSVGLDDPFDCNNQPLRAVLLQPLKRCYLIWRGNDQEIAPESENKPAA